ncbi:YjzD family protein [Peribacillus asahii]|uniref:YjzD family protein n=1 Tax=Peribacillus asahii TaxID=228899 RepID=UPI00207A5613|nr:YjzD family protein [Peribacillus asahii]USK60798.1 YjzD family protein [Peribacillus asahii]
MSYTWTFFWSFLLIHMTTYVVSSMSGVAYDFTVATILSVIVTVLVIIVASILPNEPVEKSHH